MELDGVRFEIAGNYPVGNVVKVSVSDPAAKVEFRKPDWCPKMDVAKTVDGYSLTFDMNTRVVDRLAARPETDKAAREKSWAFRRYPDNAQANRDLIPSYRTQPAAYVMHGPLVLAKSRVIGNAPAELESEPGINGKGYRARVTPLPGDGLTWGLWRLDLTKDGAPTISTKVCDFQSGGDMDCGSGGNLFSIWF